jgi:hypothetical protein
VISAIWSEDGGLKIEGDLPEGQVAVLDREWAPPGRSSAIPVVMLDADDGDATERGAAALAEIARAAVAAATEDTVAVTGSGFVTLEARRLLREQGRLVPDDAESPPAAVIETTGEPSVVREATERVRTMGTVALAGEPLARAYDLDLYPDVHLRGLRLVGVARPQRTSEMSYEGDPRLGLQEVAVGDRLDASARWYCVVAAQHR